VFALEVFLGLSPVRQIRPRIATFDSALRFFRAAEYVRALSALHGNSSVKAALLRVRCLLRLERLDDASAEIGSVEIDSLQAGDAAEAVTLLAYCKMSLGSEAIDDILLLGRVKACEAGAVEIEAEIDYVVGMSAFLHGRFDLARAAGQRIIEAVPIDASWSVHESRTYAFAELRARAYDFLGHIAGREGDLIAKANFIKLGLEQLDPLVDYDRYIEAHLLLNLAFLVPELNLPGFHDFIRARVKNVCFSEFTRKFEFEIRRALGFGHAIQGDHIGALRELRRSSDIAPSVASKVKAIIDRSMLAQELGEPMFANEECAYALELSKEVDWSAASDDEMFALLYLSRSLASRDPIEARRLYSKYMGRKQKLSPRSNVVGHRGFLGQEQQTDALIYRYANDIERSIRLNIEALANFEIVGYSWRAATVSIELFELTGEPEYLANASDFAKTVPQSHLARQVKRYSSVL